MKSSLFFTLMLTLFIMSSCGDDDGASMDLTVNIVGTYSGDLDLDDGMGFTTEIGGIQAIVTKISDTQASITLSEPVFNFIDPVTFTVTMTSASAFTVSNVEIEDVPVSGSGTVTGNTLNINLSGGGSSSVDYSGTK